MNSLLAIVFIGVLLLCLVLIVALVLVVRTLAGQTFDAPAPRPTKKLFKVLQPQAPVSASREVTPAQPLAGPDGVTHIDRTEDTNSQGEHLIDLHSVPRGELSKAVDDYLRGDGDGKTAVGAAVDAAEGEV